ncbi:unnamed protein product [Rotaria socialis]|uniref:Protein kinase domain-containing protein n=2 Tax=Rotaria socialis TaxID=392032 RepID=A0A817NWP7_9BILA|nr:unnamed protein product [Rotaria socialis]CAF3563437.1 unnamed protein product [Rotaria socialis]CAF4724930.1 unnamed protein product [Rotaria socialis]
MVKLEPIKPVIRSRSSSSDSDFDDLNSTSSSDSDLSLIETSATNSSKSCQKRKIPTSTHIIPQGTSIRDVNNSLWMIHQCVKVSHHNERFIYLCSQVKRTSNVHELKILEQTEQQNIVKTKISPLMYLTDKLKQSRQTVIDKARAENDKLDYIFYGAVIGDTNKEIELIISNNEKQAIASNKNSLNNKFLSSSANDQNSNKIIHGIVEFLKDDDTYDENKINKYSIEIIFVQDKKKYNLIANPSELLQQILKIEIKNLKEMRRKNLIINNKTNEDLHKFIITKKPGHTQYDIQESINDEGENLSSPPSSSSVESSTTKYLLKLEINTPSSSSSSKQYTIDHEIAFYSRFATHEKLKSYIKRHNLMYIAIPEYISHGTYKHLNLTYKFLIMEQYRENLRSLIYSYDQSLPEHNALNLFLQMLYVIQFIHEKNYVHQIIKPKYMMFANKQPYFIFLTQFRTVKSIHDTDSRSSEVPNENRPITANENQLVKQQNYQVKKKVKRSHRTQLAAIHNKTLSVVPSPLLVIDVPSPTIEEDNLLINANSYHHPFSVYSSLDMHLNDKQTYRGDLEMLGYNLIVWSGGRLPWDKKNKNVHFKLQRDTITNEKKLAKSNVNEFVKKCFFMKLISPVTLRAICDYMSTVYQLNIDDMPNFDQLRAPIKEIVKALGFKANACLRLSNSKSKATNTSNSTNKNVLNSSTNTQDVKTNGNISKHININDTTSPVKELEVEQDDLEDDEDEDEDDDDDDDDDDNDNDDDDEEDEEDEEEGHPCPPGSNSCDDEDDDDSSDENNDDDTQMEQQAPSIPSHATKTKCKRCGGDHSLEDQQSQTSSDKQSNSSTGPGTNNNNNTLTYQQKRQRSIAKRLQLRRKKKN